MALFYRQMQEEYRRGERVPLAPEEERKAEEEKNVTPAGARSSPLRMQRHAIKEVNSAKASAAAVANSDNGTPVPEPSAPQPTPLKSQTWSAERSMACRTAGGGMAAILSPPPRTATSATSTSFAPTPVLNFGSDSRPQGGGGQRRHQPLMSPSPSAGSGMTEAMARVLEEERRKREQFRRPSPQFRSKSPRFGRAPTPTKRGVVLKPSVDDKGYYVRTLSSSTHDFYVPPGMGDPGVRRSSSGRSGTPTLRSRVPRFQPVMMHAAGMISTVVQS